LSYTYDGSLPVKLKSSGIVNDSIEFDYNNNFHVTAKKYAGIVDEISYDNDGLLMKVGELDLTRDSQDGALTGSMMGNVTDTVEYTGFKELSGYSAQYSGAAFFDVHYERDKLGRITKKTETVPGGSTHVYDYVYNSSGYLEQVSKDGIVTGSYSYDENGNRTSYSGIHGNRSGAYDEQDRMQSYGDATYTYTSHGDLLTKTDASGTTEYDYDALGNLTKVTRFDGTVIEYIVDGNSRRIGKMVNGVLVKTWMYESQLRPVAEYDGAGILISRFVYGTKINVPDYMVKDGIYYRIITDHLGSVRYVVDVSTGSIVQSIEYDEYGIVTHNSNPGFTPFGYAGGIYDLETGLVRFGARDYDANSGRWTCKDPIGFLGGDINLYRYANNSPLNYRDPSGLWWWYGQWGGPDFTAGEERPEETLTVRDRLFPCSDRRDQCYQDHDFCIYYCIQRFRFSGVDCGMEEAWYGKIVSA
jgi:RHS repeat-associated protein